MNDSDEFDNVETADDDHDHTAAVVAADDTGMVSNEIFIVEAEQAEADVTSSS